MVVAHLAGTDSAGNAQALGLDEVAAAGMAKDLAAHATVVAPADHGEGLLAVIADLAETIRHPVPAIKHPKKHARGWAGGKRQVVWERARDRHREGVWPGLVDSWCHHSPPCTPVPPLAHSLVLLVNTLTGDAHACDGGVRIVARQGLDEMYMTIP